MIGDFLVDKASELEMMVSVAVILSIYFKILQIICKAHLEESHSAGTFEQNNAKSDDL